MKIEIVYRLGFINVGNKENQKDSKCFLQLKIIMLETGTKK